mmetsp:Transcript_63652/g.170547  ORF Transcript_63652/g.170547 Transcript_63652/m.170547 type:complete len:80 (-) Transcript_63652:1634-1873(-)
MEQQRELADVDCGLVKPRPRVREPAGWDDQGRCQHRRVHLKRVSRASPAWRIESPEDPPYKVLSDKRPRQAAEQAPLWM